MSVMELANECKKLIEMKSKLNNAYKIALESVTNKVVRNHMSEVMDIINVLQILKDEVGSKITFSFSINDLKVYDDGGVWNKPCEFKGAIYSVSSNHHVLELGMDYSNYFRPRCIWIRVDITSKNGMYDVESRVSKLQNLYLLDLEYSVKKIITTMIKEGRKHLRKLIGDVYESVKPFIDAIYKEVEKHAGDVSLQMI